MKLITMTLCLYGLGASGCATSFHGGAHVADGRAGCERKCQSENLQIAGMVYLGEYSSACVCEVPRTNAAQARASLLLSTGSTGGTVAVITAMRRRHAAAAAATEAAR
jgi:hypothetical protein